MMRRSLLIGLFSLTAACGGPLDEAMEEPSSLESIKQKLAIFDYTASATNNATDPNTSADGWTYLNQNETVMIGTCVINESAYTGDTFLRLFNPSAVEVSFNDDYCGGLGSKIHYTAPAAGNYMIRAGCYSSGSCSGTVAVARRKAVYAVPSLSNTNNASINTFNKQYYFNGGEVVRISTCTYNAYGASASGDTYLRLYQQVNGSYTNQVAVNDNPGGNCGSAAEIFYTIPSAGYYQIRSGCAANTVCSGNVAVYVE